ncbi:MFS transporter [Streptomyces sp. AJS327]|nr:MFS transporter [Streptomyces sp. AJS327]
MLALVLHLLWFYLLASGGGDLAAQDAWAEFARQHPGSAYNLAWYGGLHPFSYSVISPHLMAVIGVRTTLIVAGVLSSTLLGLLLARVVRRPMVPALAGAFAFACNAASGRVTFALGVLFGLGAVAVVWAWPARWKASRWRQYGRGVLAFLLAALATGGSPVAGLFLEVVAAALLLSRRRAAALSVALAPPVVVGISALFFPFEGMMPMPLVSVFFPLASAVGVWLCVPRAWRTVRLGAAVYGLGVALTWAIPSQVGSNVERLSLLFAGVVLLAAAPETLSSWRSRRGKAMIVALVVVMGFQLGKPIFDVIYTTPEKPWDGEVKPLVEQLEKRKAERGRVEVVPVRSHREAAALSPYVNLARGWNRQADTDRNPLFYDEKGLTPDRYHNWLRRWAVGYVVLPTDKPDDAGKDEAALVRKGQPFLREVWSDKNWKLYRVTDSLPMAESPGRVLHADANEVTVRVREPGAVVVRVPYSPWLGLVDRKGEPVANQPGAASAGCLREAEPRVGGRPAPGDDEPVLDRWTVLEAPRAGTYRIAAPYQLPRGTPCADQRSAKE